MKISRLISLIAIGLSLVACGGKNGADSGAVNPNGNAPVTLNPTGNPVGSTSVAGFRAEVAAGNFAGMLEIGNGQTAQVQRYTYGEVDNNFGNCFGSDFEREATLNNLTFSNFPGGQEYGSDVATRKSNLLNIIDTSTAQQNVGGQGKQWIFLMPDQTIKTIDVSFPLFANPTREVNNSGDGYSYCNVQIVF